MSGSHANPPREAGPETQVRLGDPEAVKRKMLRREKQTANLRVGRCSGLNPRRITASKLCPTPGLAAGPIIARSQIGFKIHGGKGIRASEERAPPWKNFPRTPASRFPALPAARQNRKTGGVHYRLVTSGGATLARGYYHIVPTGTSVGLATRAARLSLGPDAFLEFFCPDCPCDIFLSYLIIGKRFLLS